jgi:hypothetical protein
VEQGTGRIKIGDGVTPWSSLIYIPNVLQKALFAASTATVSATGTDRAPQARTLTEARMRVSSAPSGSALTAQVQHFGGSSWSTIATLTIPSGSTTEAVAALTQAQSVGHLLRLNVTSVGSTTAATGVVVEVFWV